MFSTTLWTPETQLSGGGSITYNQVGVTYNDVRYNYNGNPVTIWTKETQS